MSVSETQKKVVQGSFRCSSQTFQIEIYRIPYHKNCLKQIQRKAVI